MKEKLLKLAAKVTEHTIKVTNRTNCIFLSYQPKVPSGIKEFKK
jgi:cyclic lactone autoinducer peptide